ncbi:MAG: hypothetical protein IJJ86_07440 [Clostridia bacterium]|nr:hypothetical protein [Clostridia bacterium]
MNDAREQYGDIIDRAHPDPQTRTRMPRAKRAAQFAPFAALTGYDDLIRESARYTERRIVLDENKKEELNRKLHTLLNADPPHEAVFTCFVQDAYKSGGTYEETTGKIVNADFLHGYLTLDSGRVLDIGDVIEIGSDLFLKERN